jgi:hypothetical protein
MGGARTVVEGWTAVVGRVEGASKKNLAKVCKRSLRGPTRQGEAAMPSATHQNYVLLFRNHPELVYELARRAGVPLPGDHGRFEKPETEFDDPLLIGNTVRADLAIIEHVEERPRRGLVLEVQLDVDLNKQWTLVLYRAALRRRYHCPVWVLWFSPDEKTRASIHQSMFEDEPELRPQVVTPEMVPIVLDLDVAIDNYPWAVLAACMHANGPDAARCATVAIQALLRVAPEDNGRYIQLVAASVGETIMQQVREQLPADDQVELTEFERRGSTFTRAHREGLEQGLQGLRAALRTVLEVRGLSVDEQTQERIAACADIEELRVLIARAATITSIADLY